MGCFRIPASVCKEIEMACANFWWGTSNGKRKMHWRPWDYLCKPKLRGGLGFRKMVEFNEALLAKQPWRIIRYPDSLTARVLKGRYFKFGNVLNDRLGSNPSFIWRSLLWSRNILEKGLLWRIGDGKSIHIFEDKWVPGMISSIGKPTGNWQINDKVSSLIREGSWNRELILITFNPYVAKEILKIRLSAQSAHDTQF
ncbi:putative mitochondrial protein AtMg00310 [Primulina tabacum]|uniref:putative mitochondrial protein AtMg00310 n=1 Tax=Primulina tabacum TaxID=48773 RepID=UPI003F5A4009